jgi:hypothetical protein
MTTRTPAALTRAGGEAGPHLRAHPIDRVHPARIGIGEATFDGSLESGGQSRLFGLLAIERLEAARTTSPRVA